MVKAEKRDLSVAVEGTGTIVPRRSVEVRAQVAAVIKDVLVREGDTVRQGQLMFRLDDRNERAQLERAQAQLVRDEAAAADAQRQLQRAQELQRQNFVSQGAVDAALTALQTQQAAVAASRAAAKATEVALSLMTIHAPQPGRLGAIALHPGAFVAPAGVPLVTINEWQPALVAFSVPQRHLGSVLAAQKSGARVVEVVPVDGGAGAANGTPNGSAPGSPAGTPSPALAPVVFVDNAIDGATGTVRIKAELDNRDGRWWPGAYVRVRLRLQTLQGATTLPLAAIVQGARGRTVFVVDEDGVAQPKAVEVLDSADGIAAVKGVSPGDRVVLEGRQNLRSGTKVIERGASK